MQGQSRRRPRTRYITGTAPAELIIADLHAATLTAFALITPDTCHDGHDNPCAGQTTGGLAAADKRLSSNLPPLLSYLAANNGLRIINFAEGSVLSAGGAAALSDSSCSTCTGIGLGGRTGALLISPRLPQGATVSTAFDQYSLLRTVENSFGISDAFDCGCCRKRR